MDGGQETTAWLIELKASVVSRPTYFCGGDEPWTTDHDRAVRFCRAQDAKAVIDDYCWTEAEPVEHIWN